MTARVAAKSAALVTEMILCSMLLGPAFAGPAMGADQPGLPAASSVSPLRRGPNGDLEPVVPPKGASAAPVACQKTSPDGGTTSADQLRTLLPGHWIEVPNSHLASVAYKGASPIYGNSGSLSIMSAWSGGTFDPNNDSLIVWGGGHQDYHGNEVYAFSLKTLTWTMLDQPSSISGWSGASGILPDGTPSARHTYDSLTFIPRLNAMFEAASPASQTNGNSSSESWLFKPSAQNPNTTGVWQQTANSISSGYDDVAVYNPTTGTVWNEAPGTHGFLTEYNPTTNAWIARGTSFDPSIYGDFTGAIDPTTNRLVVVGDGHLYLWQLNLANIRYATPAVAGDLTAQNGHAPGFVWDPAVNQFVGWNGGATLYTLDPATWQWTAHLAAADNAVTPTAPAATGTYGRFQYDAANNVVVVVNDITQNVYILKPCF
jgi:hypothetical protein